MFGRPTVETVIQDLGQLDRSNIAKFPAPFYFDKIHKIRKDLPPDEVEDVNLDSVRHMAGPWASYAIANLLLQSSALHRALWTTIYRCRSREGQQLRLRPGATGFGRRGQPPPPQIASAGSQDRKTHREPY